LGFTLGGPIVRNRLAFFVDAGLQRLNLPQDVPLIGTDTTGGADSAGTGIRRESLDRFQRILAGTYHLDPGTSDPYPLTNQAGNLFGKLSWQTGVNSRIELSHGWSHAAADVLTFVGAFTCRGRRGVLPHLIGVRPTRLATTRPGWPGLPREIA
jgi:hypothetical protein